MQAPQIQQVAQTVAQPWMLLGIKLEGWLTIAAIILGPILALWAQRVSDRRREARLRKLWVFRELMATRAARLSSRHVDALNMIEMEYNAKYKKDKPVLEAWREYFDNFATTPTDPALQTAHYARREELFTDLLYEMAKYLRFPHDRLAIKRNFYSPIAHGNLEEDQNKIRHGLVALVSGERALKMEITAVPNQAAGNQAPPPPRAAPHPPPQNPHR